MIREYGPNDADTLIAIWDAADDVAHTFLPKAVKDKVREDIRNIYLPNAKTWVIMEDDLVVGGFISMIDTEIGGLFVTPDRHGMGLGRQLVDHAVALKGPLTVESSKTTKVGYHFMKNTGL